MSKLINKLKQKMLKTWLKLLKAESEHREKKVKKLERKLMELEIKMKDQKHV